MRVSLTIDYDGDLADSLRAVAKLVEEYGPDFMSDPTSFYAIHNDGAVHRVDITDPVASPSVDSDEDGEMIQAVAPAGWDSIEA